MSKTFVSIYKENCLKKGEDPIATDIYQQLDDVINWIFQQKNLENYEKALSMDRVCMAVPARLAETLYALPDGYYDTLSDKDEPLYLSSIPFDDFRAIVLEKLFEPQFNVELLRWKIRRIEKVITLGWDKFREQYQS